MLQQTQVKKVVPYFQRFMQRFPTVNDLASATEQEVLLCWAGLGYYTRARNLLQTAQIIQQNHEGKVPSEVSILTRLPGIGRYTAGAIASIAYNLPEPLVDGNVIRLLSRLFTIEESPRSAAGKRRFWRLAQSLVRIATPRLLNQGIMELGALICLPKNPRCSDCPLKTLCQARRLGKIDRYPTGASETQIRAVRETFLIISRRGRYLMVQRGRGVFYEGLWEFPRLGESEGTVAARSGSLKSDCTERSIPSVKIGEAIGTLRYRIMNRSVEACFISAELDGEIEITHPYVAHLWLTVKQMTKYPLPAPILKFVRTFLPESET